MANNKFENMNVNRYTQVKNDIIQRQISLSKLDNTDKMTRSFNVIQ